MNPNTGEIKAFRDQKKAEEAGFTVLLRGEPKKNCKKCYGRGHVGIDGDTGKYVPCSCCRMPKSDPSEETLKASLGDLARRLNDEKPKE